MKKLGYILGALALPGLALAQTQQVNNVTDIGTLIINLINNVAVPVVFAMAFIVFIFGIFRYFVVGGHDEEAKAKGQALMIWGIVGFFLMLSVWGLVHILTGSVGLDSRVPTYPGAPAQHGQP